VRESESIDWRAAFDAVCHVGAGTASSLELIASQMEATGLFGDAFERRLELMGHIEIERGPHSLAPNTWEVVAPHVIGLPQGSAALMGFRSERMMAAVDDHVWACGGKVRTTDVDGPRVIHISGLSEEQLEQLAGVMSDASRRQARFVPLAAEHLCAVLPPLSQARLGLPTTTSIQAQSYEAWNPAIARFEPADSASKLGAFRLTGFNRTYIYRTGDDFGALRATLGDARVVKYLAAADLGRSLLGYDHNAQILYVPLGADLPGLYGRAAALASGSPPVENEDERILEYHHVPPGIAGHLNYLLMS
jgi:hypothetical protein